MNRRERGSVVIEFALILPVVLVVVLAVVEFAVVAQHHLELAHAAREGAREAAANPDPAAAVAAVRRALGPDGEAAQISVARDYVVGGAATVDVVLYHAVAAPVFGGLPVRLHSHAVMRVEQ